jgi:hypothetical protein
MQGDRVHLVVLKSSGSFLNLNRVRMGVNQPRLRIRRIAPVVYWEESLFFTLRYTADETRSTAMPRPPQSIVLVFEREWWRVRHLL